MLEASLTAVAAAYTNGTQDAEKTVHLMLSAMKHRGGGDVIITRNSEDPRMALGLSGTGKRAFSEFDHCALALDGTFFKTGRRGLSHIAIQQSLKDFSSIASLPGAFAVIYFQKGKLRAVRDLNGLKPLYYSHGDGLTAIASERKALWRIGAGEVYRILPGQLYTATSGRLTKRCLFKLPRPVEREMSMARASATLKRLLIKSTKLITNDVKKVAVAFSGGLDSAITALLAKQANLEVGLVSTGLEGSQELQTVEGYARELGLPISVETYEADSLEEYVRRIVWLIEEPDLMKVSVAIPLYWAAKLASKRGYSVLLCGQGSDELYGGYYRYARILDSEGRRVLLSELYRSIVESPQVNYERDEQATCPTGVELRTPFANLDVIQFSFQIPTRFKVKEGNDLMRKWVLREAARKAGLPESIVWRRKKAIQHGTGVENAIRRLAKTQQLAVDSYLTGINESLSNVEEMP